MKLKPRVCPVGHRYYNKRGECQHCRAIKDRRCNDYFRALSEQMLRGAA